MWGSWYANLITGHTEQALELANELVEVSERLSDPDLIIEAYHSRWANSHLLGLNSITFADAQRGIALYDAERHHSHVYDYGGHDTGVCAYAHSAVALWISGFAEQAVQMSTAALELGRKLEHPPSLAHAAWWSAALRQLLREAGSCRELCELTVSIGREQGSNMFVVAPLLLGWTTLESGHEADGLRAMEEAVAATRQSARRFYYDYELLVLAEALLKVDKADRAKPLIDEALDLIGASKNRLFEAEALRLAALCLVRGGRIGEAEARLLEAIQLSHQQGALSFKLRAAMSLARLWIARNWRGEAHDVLWGVYSQFTEGLGTPDLIDAKALLDGLASPEAPRG
jgi:predicted ATPase